MAGTTEPALTAPHRLAYTYKRSLGLVLSKFFTGLRDRQLYGIRRADGRVLVPPKEYDPDTGEALSELVPVKDTGVVTSWAWVHAPRAKQPLAHPFAYALIRLDGASTPLLHVVDAGSESRMKTGMRVRARWAEQTVGALTDIAAFVPETPASGARSEPTRGLASSEASGVQGVIDLIKTPIELEYTYSAGQSASRFLRAIAQGKLLGQRCPVDGRVYFPSRGSCPQHGVPFTGDVVELPDKGTVVTFSIVRVPSPNIPLELPYIAVQVLLDGADTVLMHVLKCKLEDVHMGMRVAATWKPREEWTTSVANILYFEPIAEPDAPYDSYKEHI